MTECRDGCGRCCDPVVLGYSRGQAEMNPHILHPDDLRWVLNDLMPITRREGLTRTKDYLSGGATDWIHQGVPIIVYSFFYECRHYDRETKRCLNYEGRPPNCRDYPWYGEAPDGKKALPPECSYLADVPVQIGPRR